MILEVAILNVKPDLTQQFETNFKRASPIISSVEGYRSHTLNRCIEDPGKYVLLVEWDKLEDHTVTFRESSRYQEWKALLHHFYDPFPTVQHFQEVPLQ
ncbi:MAG: antibiotic biosynthesis monooxygenase [Spirochaetia bacterium]|nr:antibiotic biosynthesis monooxygenase [Spirochaetia bacterium]